MMGAQDNEWIKFYRKASSYLNHSLIRAVNSRAKSNDQATDVT